MSDEAKIPTPAQLRAARGLLGWTQTDLGARAGVPVDTVSRIEGERRPASRRTRGALRAALESAGIAWTGTTGVDRPAG